MPFENILLHNSTKLWASFQPVVSSEGVSQISALYKVTENKNGSHIGTRGLKTYNMAHNSLLLNKLQCFRNKLLPGWNMVPQRLAMFGTGLSNCLRGCCTIDSPKYVWWDCPKVRCFGSSVSNLLINHLGQRYQT